MAARPPRRRRARAPQGRQSNGATRTRLHAMDEMLRWYHRAAARIALPMIDLYSLFRPLLFAADPEAAHAVTFKALDTAARLGIAQALAPKLPARPVTVMGITFPNRVGLAAGLDKNAEHLMGLSTLGFGFIEAGTVTPRPQPGNPK